MKIIDIFLTQLGVLHSKTFLQELVMSTPHYSTMYGIKSILSHYGIETMGIYYKDKIDAELSFPCILHIEDRFVVARDLYDNIISYNDGFHLRLQDVTSFCKQWTGHALLPINKKGAKEPNVLNNIIKDIYRVIESYFPLLFVLSFACVSIFSHFSNIGFIINVLLDLFGLFTCTFLLQKQLYGGSKIGDKICSVLQKSSCDNIINTKEAKLWELISWSEIGLSYFSARIIYYGVYGTLGISQIVGWFAMLFGIWSIWYQIKAKQWCTLCVLVQCFVWVGGIYNFFAFEGTTNPFISTLLYFIITLLSTIVIHNYVNSKQFEEKLNELRPILLNIKSDQRVLNILLQSSTKVSLDKGGSDIVFGNRNAKSTLTVLTNPHCNPCASMHEKIERLLLSNPNIKIQYVFSSFSKELESSNKFLIAVYLQKPYQEALQIMKEWYEYGKYQPEKFIQNIQINIEAPEVLSEHSKHLAWKEESKISVTPTILFNNIVLPDEYSISDFEYIDIED